MARESSAVAHFVSLAQAQGIEEVGREGASGMPTPKSGIAFALLGLIVVACAVVGGYLLAVSSDSAPFSTESEASQIQPAALLAGEPAPTVTMLLAPEDIELAKNTGFDVVVTPAGAQVSLDGRVIGLAPLRVRNLLSGKHALDIEAVDGYFGQHFEFELTAGKAEVLTILLDPVDPMAVPALVEPLEEPAVVELVTEAEVRQEPAKQRRAKRSKKKATSSDELGTLLLGAKPPCQIIIDGKKTGLTTPQRSIRLSEGKHQVVLVNQEHGLRKSFKVNIKSGRKTRAIVDLSKKL